VQFLSAGAGGFADGLEVEEFGDFVGGDGTGFRSQTDECWEVADASGWTGFTSFGMLVEKARSLRLGKVESLGLEFGSLTTFSRGNAKNRIYGGHFARVPMPQYVFPGLARRWQELAPPELAGVVQMERVQQYVDDEGVVIRDYDLRPHEVRFTTHVQPGFVGVCSYDVRGPDEPVTEEAPLTVRQQLLLLGQLAFYCGV
jgi:hypothetical protein